MTDTKYDPQALSRLQVRVAGKLAEINQMLAPGVSNGLTAEEIQLAASRHIDQLSPAAQEQLRRQALVAYAELQRLTAQMMEQLDLLTDEIAKVTRHTRAATAYRHAPKPAQPIFARL